MTVPLGVQEDDVWMKPKKQPEEPKERLVVPEDLPWISEEIATQVLKRAADGSKPIPWSQVDAELAEMDRLGV
jgi:hypothetical protein